MGRPVEGAAAMGARCSMGRSCRFRGGASRSSCPVNEFFTRPLLEGAQDAFRRHGVEDGRRRGLGAGVLRDAPGGEAPGRDRALRGSGLHGGRHRGATSHFDHVAGQAAARSGPGRARHRGPGHLRDHHHGRPRPGRSSAPKAGNKGQGGGIEMADMAQLPPALTAVDGPPELVDTAGPFFRPRRAHGTKPRDLPRH